jgi:hypothetical protein
LIGAGVASVVLNLWYPNTGSIVQNPALEVYINGTPYANQTAVDWGAREAGQTYQFDNMTVKNSGTVALTILVVTEGLPTGWTLTWTANNTALNPGAKAEAPLQLSIPLSASSWGSWGFHIYGE